MPLVKQILDADNQDLDSENCKDLFDSKLQNNYEKEDMIRIIYSAVACVYKPVKLRPQMSQVSSKNKPVIFGLVNKILHII